MWRFAAILFVAHAAHAQSVDGTVADSISHKPLPNVIVTLLGPHRYNGTTDETGAFHIDLVEPGKYVLNIVLAGYLLPLAKRDVQVGSEAVRISIEMEPLGRIEGRVTYPDGTPARRAPVWLGANATGIQNRVDTDSEGRYFFEDIKPGTYVVRAGPGPADAAPEDGVWVPTWFPRELDRASAEPIHVATGTVFAAVIRLRSAPARRLHGIVRDETGQPAGGVTIKLAGEQTTVTTKDGAFDFTTRDGDWRLNANLKTGSVERKGWTTVTLARHDIENAEIRLALPFSVPVEIDRGDTPDDPRRPLMFFLMPEDGAPAGVSVRPSPIRSIDNVYPGRYSLNVRTTTPGEYVESVKFGSAEVNRQYFAIWDGSLPLRIKIAQGGATVHATVENGEAAVFILLDADDTIQAGRVAGFGGQSGKRIDITGLRPGDYYLFAFDRNEGQLFVPPFLTSLLSQAVKLHLAKGDNLTVTVKLTPLPPQ